MLSYFKFFLFMIAGLSLFQVLFSWFNQTIIYIIGVSLITTFFKWLFERVIERKSDGSESP
ncbi:hypothetical protein SAMN04488054_10886 [Salibacterium qingdaonense]|uniref:Uncharacterized protein n=1 Tax=Salibacterium qingdaonense TaxID=266892 RepID=A0A1I4LPS6_9BACI|nr:hypothetical protein SAMN04488054_10886 [Salibacterium qingdaonense]